MSSLSTFFCKVDVIFWQNLVHYDTEKVLVSTEILLLDIVGSLFLGHVTVCTPSFILGAKSSSRSDKATKC